MPRLSPLNTGIDRVAAVLRAIGQAHRSGARLIDIATASGLSKSTTHRLLAGLVGAGLVEQDQETSVFYLSFDFFVLGAASANRHGIVEIASASTAKLANRTEDTVFLLVRSGLDAVCVHREEGNFPIKVLTLSAGDIRPLGAGGAGGLALFAFLPDDEIESILERNAARLSNYPGFSLTSLYEQIEAARRSGYSFNPGRIVSGMSAIGAPIRAADGRPIAAISVAAVATRMQPERQQTIVNWLMAEVKALEANLASLTQVGLGRFTKSRRAGLPVNTVLQMGKDSA